MIVQCHGSFEIYSSLCLSFIFLFHDLTLEYWIFHYSFYTSQILFSHIKLFFSCFLLLTTINQIFTCKARDSHARHAKLYVWQEPRLARIRIWPVKRRKWFWRRRQTWSNVVDDARTGLLLQTTRSTSISVKSKVLANQTPTVL